MYASAIAVSASSPRFPSAARWNVSSVSRKQRATAACEELLLRAEEAEDVRLRDAGPLGDGLRRGPVEPALGELHERCIEDLVAPLLGGLAFD